ncbi:molybdenum cofactor guanylyltransferase MobA [Collimonas pratensis]|uniref:Molybdenum cofactor guanylyltransferase n=1 Tax=Collimonas pratensis TaxID=279113 RepID=A0ABN4MCA1_9BURK|nr:molybdenum cofactor guanylyltransferase MobA [Collimonas pratensis]AMP13969.1 molybdopterin-guanine dinucleotide biosynthesis protein A [Collimonas pratensis]NKI68569.1 molybdenum cofactor guanylyltransferase MobA [Collimonas pratensis]
MQTRVHPDLASLTTGLILAGGRGTRMGGIDKGLALLDGQTMVAHVVARLAPQVGSLIINANRSQARYAAFGYPVWPDQQADFAGPLAGLQAGLCHCTTPYLLTAPCDSPYLPEDLLQNLAKALQNAAADVAVAVTTDPDTLTLQPQPVFMLLKRSLLTDLNDYLQGGGRKIEAWYRRLNYSEALFDDGDAFRNINTEEQLQSSRRTH